MGDVRRGTKSEIDKAHVLRAAEAESPWLEVSTVGLSCRLLIAGTMQQMALIAIPTHGLPALEFSFVPLSPSSRTELPFLPPPPPPPFFSHPSSRASSPPDSIPTSRDSMCSISSRRQANHLRTEDVILEFHPWSLFPSDQLRT